MYYEKYLKYKTKYLNYKKDKQILNKLTNKLLFNKSTPNIILDEKNIFGVFVSIERSKMQQLQEYPKDIHGCIGYWDNNFNKLDNDLINNKIIKTGYNAYFKDNRRSYFIKNPTTDIFTKIKIYFMKLPIYNVDDNGLIIKINKYFNNNDYGLIIQNESSRATYLPNVFPNNDWKYIKDHLKSKASISTNTDINYIAYETDIIEWYLLDFIIYNINLSLQNLYNDFIPYSIINKKIIIDKSQDIRNIATMYDIYNMVTIFKLNDILINKIKDNINYYIINYNESMRQSSAFLLLLLNKLNLDKDLQKKIIENLYDNIEDLESKFELGEVLMSLSYVEPRKEIINNQIDKIIKMIDNKIYNIDDIFQYNWLSKFILAYYNYDKDNYIFNSGLYNILYNKIINIKIDNNYKTNYIVVAYECLSSILLLSKYYNNDNNNIIIENIYNLTEILFLRINIDYYLLEFKNKEMRLDITGHFINGLINMYNYYQIL